MPGSLSSAGLIAAGIAAVDNLGLTLGTVIENLTGSVWDDVLIGNNAANRIAGGGGNDWIDGGKGSDTAVFAGARDAYTVTRQYDKVLVQANNGAGGLATLVNIEWLEFSNAVEAASSTAAPDDHAGNTSTDALLTLVTPMPGSIESAGDNDWYKVILTLGQTYRFELLGADGAGGTLGAGPIAEARMALYDAGGTLLLATLNGGTGQDPKIDFVAPQGGAYYLGVDDLYGTGTGTYTLRAAQLDVTAPTVTQFAPAPASTTAAIGVNIMLTFDEPVKRGVGDILLKTAAGTVVASYAAASSTNLIFSGNTLTIDPSAYLVYGTAYVVVLPGGSVLDLPGNAYAGTSSYGFSTTTTVDSTAPVASGFNPANGAVGVDPVGNLVVTFSEAIERGTGNLLLKTAGATVVATWDAATSNRLSISGNALTVDPAADLAIGTNYTVEFAAGTFKDLAGNGLAAGTIYSFTTIQPGQVLGGTAAAESLPGSAGSDTINGLGGSDTITGAGGNDSIDGGTGSDTAMFTGDRSQYQLSRSGGTIQVPDTVGGRDGTDTLTNVETLRFADRTVDLTMGSRVQGLPAASLKTLEELYVGFFNRVPEASGLGYWIDLVKGGLPLTSVADQFYAAGVQFGLYPASMTNAQFIQEIYKNVLFRPPGSATAPNADEIAYWNNRLVKGLDTKGTMVLQMLHDVHAGFENHPVYGFVAASLNNKALVANYYAVAQGLGYLDAQTNISFGVQLAAAITPTDTSAAIALIGVNDFSLL